MNQGDAKVEAAAHPQQPHGATAGSGFDFNNLKSKATHYCYAAYRTGTDYVLRNAWQLIVRLVAIYFLFFFLSQVFTFIKPVPLYLALIFTIILAFLRV